MLKGEKVKIKVLSINNNAKHIVKKERENERKKSKLPALETGRGGDECCGLLEK